MTPDWISFLTEQGAHFAPAQAASDTAPARPASIAFHDSSTATAPASVVPLCHLDVLISRGEDSAAFLHNLLSNDVKGLENGQGHWTSFNTPKGRMLANPLLWRHGDAHYLLMAQDILPAIQKKLSMYVLRSKVKLSAGSAEHALLGVCGPEALHTLERAGLAPSAEALQCVSHGEVQVIRITEQLFVVVAQQAEAAACFQALRQAGAAAGGTDTWTLAMIRAGLPLITAATQEAFVAQMLNYELLGGINFKKGCYPGQEIVARTQYLGKPKRRMYRLQLPVAHAPEPGSAVFSPEFGDQAAGEFVNVAPDGQGGFEALAVVRTSAADSGEIHIGTVDGPLATRLDLPYALP